MSEPPPDENWGTWGNPPASVRRALPSSFPDHPPSDPWELRRLIACRKTMRGGTQKAWSQEPIPTRLGPYPRPRPAGRYTEWRAARLAGEPFHFILLCLAQAARDHFRAWLIVDDDDHRFVIERWEHHGAHTPDGIHSHTWCNVPKPPFNAASIDAPRRLPGTRAYHRRAGRIWSKETFWIAACRRFAIDDASVRQAELI